MSALSNSIRRPATATSSADKPAKVVLRDKTLTEPQVHQLLARGYKAEGHGGEVYYCHREQQLGSRFETKVCRTAAQISEDLLASQEMIERRQRTGNPGGN